MGDPLPDAKLKEDPEAKLEEDKERVNWSVCEETLETLGEDAGEDASRKSWGEGDVGNFGVDSRKGAAKEEEEEEEEEEGTGLIEFAKGPDDGAAFKTVDKSSNGWSSFDDLLYEDRGSLNASLLGILADWLCRSKAGLGALLELPLRGSFL